MKVPSADQLPECPECRKRPADERRVDSVTQLSANELGEWESEVERIDKGGVRHSVDAAKLIGEYDVAETQHCSYFRHPHGHGLLIEARCGALLSIGIDCGRRYIGGFGKVEREIGVARALQTERELQHTEPKRLLGNLSELAAQVGRRLEGLKALQKHVPKVFEAMRRAYSMSDYSVQVRVKRFDTETLTEREVEEHQLLRGMQLFGGLLSNARLDEILGKAKFFADDVARIEIDHGNYVRIRDTRQELREQENKLHEWLDQTAKFWSERNLALALIKAYDHRVPPSVTVEGQTIVAAGSPRTVVGIEG